MSEIVPKKQGPVVKYRVELEKRIEINKSYAERRNRAIAMRILSYGLFGQKRYQNLYLSCSLNCFYWALTIANAMHQRVAGLALIIKFEVVHVIEYYAEEFEGKTYRDKKYTKINIKLTKSPTDDDKKEPGYNPGLNATDITEPLTEVMDRGRREGYNTERPQRNNRRNDRNYRGRNDREDRGERGGYRGDRGGYRGETRNRPREDQNNRRNEGQNEGRNEGRNEEGHNRSRYSDRERQGGRNDKGGERRDDRNRDDRTVRKEYEPKRREERNERRYGDDRDERRQYRDKPNNRPKDNKNDTIPRGQKKTRGSAYGGGKPRGDDNAKESDAYPRRDRQEGSRYGDRRQQGRGDDRGNRGPKRTRYSDDEN